MTNPFIKSGQDGFLTRRGASGAAKTRGGMGRATDVSTPSGIGISTAASVGGGCAGVASSSFQPLFTAVSAGVAAADAVGEEVAGG